MRFESTLSKEGKIEIARSFLLPAAVKRSRGIEPNLLWDNLGYVLGVGDGEKQTEPERLKSQKKSFYERIKQVADETNDTNLNAVLAFGKVTKKEL